MPVIPYESPIPTEVAVSSPDGITVIYAGRLEEEQKRISQVLDVLWDCEQAIPQFRGKVYGSGTMAEVLADRLVRVGSKRIQLMGPVSSDTIQDKLSEGQVFLLLSEYEGLPIALMEAMAVGLVPIVRRIRSGIDELVVNGENSFIFDDDSEVLPLIERLNRDPELWNRLSCEARNHIERLYSLERGIIGWAKLIREIGSPFTIPRKIKKPRLPRPDPELGQDSRLYRETIGRRVKVKLLKTARKIGKSR